MTDKVHDASDASVIENITDTPRPSLIVGATGETISYQMCNDGIGVSQNCSRLTKFICPIRLADKPWLKVLLTDLL